MWPTSEPPAVNYQDDCTTKAMVLNKLKRWATANSNDKFFIPVMCYKLTHIEDTLQNTYCVYVFVVLVKTGVRSNTGKSRMSHISL